MRDEKVRKKVLRVLREQYRGMLRLRCNTPEAARITEELRLRITDIYLFA